MTETEPAVPAPFDSGQANIARVYDYLLGGKDNYAADRKLAEELVSQQPAIQVNARANRAFMQRAVRFLADAGIDQFLDVGTGLPTGENVHQIAQSVNPSARVLYMDNDKVVAAHSRALLMRGNGVEFVLADLREPAEIIARAQAQLDLSRPVAVLLISMLHFVPDDTEAAAIVQALTEPLAAGSYLVVSHYQYLPADDELASKYSGSVHTLARRSREQIGALLPSDWSVTEPGLVPVTAWRPPPDELPGPQAIQIMGVVARKP